MEPGLSLTVTQDNPLFRPILSSLGVLTEDDNGNLTLIRAVSPDVKPRAKIKVQIEDGEPVTYVFNLQEGSMMDYNRGFVIETHWETRDAIHRRI